MTESANLRPMVQDDLELVLEWRNSEPVRKNMYTQHLISKEEHAAWWERESSNPRTRLLIFELDGSASGVVTFTNYTGVGGVSSWAFYSGDLARRGIGAMMEKSALSYAFENLKVRRLECEVLSYNSAVIKFHLKHGFTLEGILRSAYLRDGEAFDIYKLSMLAEEWERFVRPNLDTLGRKGKGSLLGAEFRKKVNISEEHVKLFSEACGDRNSIHWDSKAAIAAGFEGPIAHGMLVASLFSEIFANELPGPGSIYLSQELNFLAPVHVGSDVEVAVAVQSHVGRKVRLMTKVELDGEVCIEGAAELLAPKS